MLWIASKVEICVNKEWNKLTDDRCNCRTVNSKLWATAPAENHNRVKYHIYNRTYNLSNCSLHCVTCCLQQLFKNHIHTHTEWTVCADFEVGNSHWCDNRVACLWGNVCVNSENSEKYEHNAGAKCKKNWIAWNFTALFLVALSKTSRQNRVNADSRSYSDRNHKHLDRKCKR